MVLPINSIRRIKEDEINKKKIAKIKNNIYTIISSYMLINNVDYLPVDLVYNRSSYTREEIYNTILLMEQQALVRRFLKEDVICITLVHGL